MSDKGASSPVFSGRHIWNNLRGISVEGGRRIKTNVLRERTEIVRAVVGGWVGGWVVLMVVL